MAYTAEDHTACQVADDLADMLAARDFGYVTYDAYWGFGDDPSTVVVTCWINRQPRKFLLRVEDLPAESGT